MKVSKWIKNKLNHDGKFRIYVNVCGYPEIKVYAYSHEHAMRIAYEKLHKRAMKRGDTTYDLFVSHGLVTSSNSNVPYGKNYKVDWEVK